MIDPPRLRNVLFIPGNRADMLAKAARYAPDAFIPDMEDSVPPDEKATARQTIAEALPSLTRIGPPVIPRVNSPGSMLLEEDLHAVVGNGITGVSVGKIRSVEVVLEIDRVLTTLEGKAGVSAGSTYMLLWIETASAVMAVREIAVATPRVRWLAFGADDFTADMGIWRQAGGEREAPEPGLLYPRSAVAIAARAAGIEALDTPYVSFLDEPGLVRESRLARRLGFTGKCAIHPSQIEPISRVFAPAPDEIDYARRVIAAWEEAESQGRGATSLDGDLIDTPVVERARRLIASLDQGKTR